MRRGQDRVRTLDLGLRSGARCQNASHDASQMPLTIWAIVHYCVSNSCCNQHCQRANCQILLHQQLGTQQWAKSQSALCALRSPRRAAAFNQTVSQPPRELGCRAGDAAPLDVLFPASLSQSRIPAATSIEQTVRSCCTQQFANSQSALCALSWAAGTIWYSIFSCRVRFWLKSCSEDIRFLILFSLMTYPA